MIPLKPGLTGPHLTNMTEIKERAAILATKMRRIKVKKLWGLNCQRKIGYEPINEGGIERIDETSRVHGKIDVYV